MITGKILCSRIYFPEHIEIQWGRYILEHSISPENIGCYKLNTYAGIEDKA
jgi:hypothetical protein